MKSVLLIDGSEMFCDFLKDKFTTEQVSLTYIPRREAYTKIITLLPDLIIIELKDGLDDDLYNLLEKKRTDPNAKKIPVILTGPTEPREKIAALVEYNVVKYFNKPIKFEVFFESVGRILHAVFSMDTTPCILDMHLNANVIFVEIAMGLNREKLSLLKYKLAAIIEKHELTNPKIILMLTNLQLSFIDGANLELLLDNVSVNKTVPNRNIKILSFDKFVRELIKGHPEYTGIQVSDNLTSIIGSVLNQDSNYGTNDFIYDKVLSSDDSKNDSMDFVESRDNSKKDGGGSILSAAIVDDDIVIRKLLQNSFSSISSETSLFATGTEFMKAISQGNEYSVIVLDIFLPDMNGFDILASLQRQNCSTPIIVYSRTADREYVIKSLSLGAKSYIVKPQKPNVIIEKVIQLLHSNG